MGPGPDRSGRRPRDSSDPHHSGRDRRRHHPPKPWRPRTRHVAPALLAQFRHDAAHQYTILEVTPALLADAERPAEIHGLRAYDAVQLAAAADLHRERLANGLSRPTLISADQDLNAAAIAEGLDVDDPTTNP